MLTRILVAVIGIPILLFVLCFAPAWATLALLALLVVIGAYELMHCTCSKEKGKRWFILPAIIGVLLLLKTYLGSATFPNDYTNGLIRFVGNISAEALLMISITILFLLMILKHGRKSTISFNDVLYMLFAGVAIPYTLSTLLSIRLMEYGSGLVMIPLVAAFSSDAAALFAGKGLGHKKLIERVSPNKTVAGAIGGLAGGAVGMILFRICFFLVNEVALNILWCIVLGIVGSIMGQIGDLAFSCIKREHNIKDYGKLLPGHGGVLDRFDSVIFASPVIYLLLQIIKLY